MTYFYTDDHTWINDDQCDILSDYMCQLKLKSQGKSKPVYNMGNKVFIDKF